MQYFSTFISSNTNKCFLLCFQRKKNNKALKIHRKEAKEQKIQLIKSNID